MATPHESTVASVSEGLGVSKGGEFTARGQIQVSSRLPVGFRPPRNPMSAATGVTMSPEVTLVINGQNFKLMKS